ncbi:MAG: tRNA dihydrouridine synthase DusB, partial [Deltaproteobacteria bacterium]|nr:tRNA dihydrouridine synthase DusB [Deltaproteobacteria bacterium]
FGGRPDWQVIRAVKQAVNMPVIGNGDIQCYGDGLKMMSETGCDGVMIGRGALGNPWVFRPGGRPETLGGRLPVIRRHLELAKRFLPAERMLFRIKNHAGRYLAGLHGAGKLRQKITDCSSLAQIIDLFENLS